MRLVVDKVVVGLVVVVVSFVVVGVVVVVGSGWRRGRGGGWQWQGRVRGGGGVAALNRTPLPLYFLPHFLLHLPSFSNSSIFLSMSNH